MALLRNDVQEISAYGRSFEVRVQITDDDTLTLSVEAEKGEPGEIMGVACLALFKRHLDAMGVGYRELQRKNLERTERFTDALVMPSTADRAAEFLALLQSIIEPAAGMPS